MAGEWIKSEEAVFVLYMIAGLSVRLGKAG